LLSQTSTHPGVESSNYVLERAIHPCVVQEQERLGHSTTAITLGVYSHVSPTLHDNSASHVAALIHPQIRNPTA